MTDDDTTPQFNETLPTPSAGRAITLDVARYEGFLAASDLTEDERREFLEALWTIIVSFVDLGFGVHPLQQVGLDVACGQNPLKPDLAESVAANVVGSFSSMTQDDATQEARAGRNPKEAGR